MVTCSRSNAFPTIQASKACAIRSYRALQFRDICFASNGHMSGAVLWALGKLVDESQTSCIDCDHSCPELDELTRICCNAGAADGAYGEGFTVSLVAEDKVPQVIEKLRRSYGPFTKLNDEEAMEVIFATAE